MRAAFSLKLCVFLCCIVFCPLREGPNFSASWKERVIILSIESRGRVTFLVHFNKFIRRNSSPIPIINDYSLARCSIVRESEV